MRAKHPFILLFIFMCFILPTASISQVFGLNYAIVASTIDDTYGPELLLDPFLSESPSFSINGTSDGFSHAFHQTSGGSDFNYVNLTWTHTAGTNYSYKSERTPPYPQSNDFILLTQDLVWSWETLPIQVITGFDYRITRTGDFETNEYWNRMFDVSRWLIDSSGNWELCGGGDFSTESPDDFNQVASALQGMPRNEIFGGMIENSEGVQEDPEDRLTLAIGLAPSILFLDYHFVESAYLNWTGTVTVTFRSISCAAFGSTDPDSIPTPPRFGFWQSQIYSRGDGVTVAPDGNVYTVGTEGDYDSGDLDLVLQKWNMDANLLWTQQISGETIDIGVDVLVSDSGSIYTLGRYRPVFGASANASIVVTQWDSSGNQIESMLLETEFGGSPQSFVMDSQGNFYIAGALDLGHNGSYYNTVFKCDPDLDIVWVRTVGDLSTIGSNSITIDSDDNVYVTGFYGQMGKIDVDGNILWEKTDISLSVVVGEDDYLYSLGWYRGLVFVAKHNCDTGSQIWNTTWGYRWYGYPIFDHRPIDIAVGSDGLVSTISSINPALGSDLPIVASFNATNGAHLWNYTWLPDMPHRAWSFYPNFGDRIAVGAGNRIFVTGSAYVGTDSSAQGVIALAVVDPSLQTGGIGSQWLVTLAGGAGVVIIALAIIILKRKRSV
ncbi:MAG: hypothetical protein RTS72_00740 [Candidatus Thorarchaeota archaeon]